MSRAGLTEKLLDIKRDQHAERGPVSRLAACDPAHQPVDLSLLRAGDDGTAWKELIQEEFGDGIMSAIDLDMTLERQPDNRGDRVKLTASGKFLPYKYFGHDDDTPEDGRRER